MRAGLLAAVVLAVPGPRPALAALSDNLQGFLDVTAVQSEVDGIGRNSLRQQYTANWSKKVVPFVTARASFRYFRFDLRSDQLPDALREELQPSGELLWRHPQFSFGASARRRTARVSALEGQQVGDNLALNFTTQDLSRPRLLLRYDWDHVFNRKGGRDLDTKDQRIQATLTHTARGHALAYSYTRRQADNVISGVRGTESTNVFRWGSPVFRPNRKMTVTSTYTFTHRDQTQEQADGGRILVLVPGAAGLYAEDSSPDTGALEGVPSLTDLNTVEPAVPPIDIGGAFIFRNLGLNFGFERLVTVMYVYTDRLSGAQPGWDVWVSRDNLDWELWDASPTTLFNPESSRYEITFPSAFTRYVKVVNRGVNEESEVLVTELEALAESDEEGKVTRRGGGHRFDLGADYDFTERLGSTLDTSYESVPFSGISGERRRGDYALGTKYRMARTILHAARWQQGFDELGGGAVEERTSNASYTLLYEPLQTLRFTTSLDGRMDHRNGEKTNESRGIVFRVFGTPVRSANLSSDISRSRQKQHDFGTYSDVWSFRVSADGSVTRRLTAALTFSQQRTTSQPENELRVRNLYGANFDWRVTRTIFARGSYNLVREVADEVAQDYLVSWNAAPKLTLGGQASFIRTRLGRNTERYNANLTYNLTTRSTLYSTYNLVDFTEVGGSETASFQLGLRAGF